MSLFLPAKFSQRFRVPVSFRYPFFGVFIFSDSGFLLLLTNLFSGILDSKIQGPTSFHYPDCFSA